MNEARNYNNLNHHPSPELSVVSEIIHEHHMDPNPAIHGSTLSKRKKLTKTKKRFYAFNVDLYGIIIFHKIALYSYINFINTSFDQAPMNIKNILLENMNQMYISTFMFTYFSYFLVSFFLGHGKTIGMTLFELRTVGSEDSPQELSFMESFMRALGYTVNYLLIFTPFLINLVRKDSKGIPDFFSQTQVMTEKEFINFEHALKMQQLRKKTDFERARVVPFPAPAKSEQLEEVQQLDLFSSIS